MASLVADYGVSSSDSDCDSDSGETELNHTGVLLGIADTDEPLSGGLNMLTNSDDSSDSEDDTTTQTSTSKSQIPEKLPLPGIFSDTTRDRTLGKCTSSIYANPFKDQEDAKTSILEQHVKLSVVEKQEQKQKNVCYKYLKGKCRFGDKCKFAHSGKTPINRGNSNSTGGETTTVAQQTGLDMDSNADQDEDAAQNKKRKHRPGVTNTLLPPKKAMKAYTKQKKSERPWMT